MKKILVSIALSTCLLLNANAESVAKVVTNGTMVNLLSLEPANSAKITQIVMTATTSTNFTLQFFDVATNQTFKITPAYTNTISYATNIVTMWTNYFGLTNYMTNLALVANTNNLVGAYTNYQATLILGTGGNTSTKFDQVNYYFHTGVWVTNGSGGIGAVTLTYQR